ncbi:MAG: DUF2135 domain-containing protein, partial [Bacteroidota bacterium]|nr:DUF2135 domain-containing protein [Bacteroidota bacterium]MDX5429915.1 DUF2135 domain-containing protein [Bacteroidota bacterium]MDX5468689.1 DUF2135 domain-containing protein [Bacteroidota bacterium]
PDDSLVIDRKAPRNPLILWDASASVDTIDKRKMLEFLREIHQNWPGIKPTLQVLQYPIPDPKEFETLGELTDHLETIPHDGASVFHLPGDLKISDEIWLFSDGQLNMSAIPESLPLPCYAISPGAAGFYSYLPYLAQQSGGGFVRLDGLRDRSPWEAISTRQARIRTIEGAKSNWNMHWQGAPAKGWIFVPVARNQTEIKLDLLASNGAPYSVVLDDFLSINDNEPLIRQWLYGFAEFLEAVYPEKEKELLRDLSNKHHFVSSGASLLVLDELQDYLTYRIEPAEADLKRAYHAALKQQETEQKMTYTQHLEQITQTYFSYKEKYLEVYTPDYSSKRNGNNGDFDTLHYYDSVVTLSNFMAGTDEGHEAVEAEMNATEEVAQEETTTETEDRFTLIPYDPGNDAFRRWKKMLPGELYEDFLKKRDLSQSSPALYLDVSYLLAEKGQKELAIRVISNLAELNPDSDQLLRILGKRLMEYEEFEMAVQVFEQVVRLKGEEPQSYRDLALALEATGKYQEAYNMFAYIALSQWDDRFPEIEQIAIEEAQHVWFRHREEVKDDSLPPVFREVIPKDVRVVIDWDKDLCDIDLWVDNGNETCMYNNRFALDGGILSHDFVGGYGPEVYQVSKMTDRKLKVKVNYFGSTNTRLLGETVVQLKVYRNYGTGFEKSRSQFIRLNDKGETLDVAEILPE